MILRSRAAFWLSDPRAKRQSATLAAPPYLRLARLAARGREESAQTLKSTNLATVGSPQQSRSTSASTNYDDSSAASDHMAGAAPCRKPPNAAHLLARG
eukprot:6201002-Pleurochrysis_carterae.AAC.1